MISVMVWVARQRQVEQVREPLRLKGDDRVEVVVQQQLRRGLLLHVAAEEREERPVSAPDDLCPSDFPPLLLSEPGRRLPLLSSSLANGLGPRSGRDGLPFPRPNEFFSPDFSP